jgi:hypothetical protein
MTLTLQPTEQEVVRWWVERTLPGLRFEIANTEDAEFRRYLSARETVLEGLLHRLAREDEAATAVSE